MVTLDTNPFESNEDQYDVELERIDEVDGEPMLVVDAQSYPKKLLFECGKCTYQSQSQKLFNLHIARHSKDRPFECSLCQYSDLDHSKFVDHLAFHQQGGLIQCPYCPRALDIPAMKLHMLIHRAMESFDCSLCDFSSNHAKSLKYHTELYHYELFKREYCQKRMFKHSLMKNYNVLHDVKDVSAELGNHCQCPLLAKCCSLYSDSLVKIEDAESCGNGNEGASSTHIVGTIGEFKAEELANDETEIFSCQICEFSSHLRVLLKFHVLSMHTKKVSKSSRKSSNLVRNPKSSANTLQSGNRLMCSICEFSTLRKANLLTHIDKLHSRKFSCNFCPLITTKYALIKHNSLVHGVTINLKSRFIVEVEPSMIDNDSASDGGQSFTSGVVPDNTDNFSHQTHIDMNQFIEHKEDILFCKICKYSQSWKPQMESHIEKLHVKLYHCKYCSTVMTKYDLIEHSMESHNVVMSIKTPGLREYRQQMYGASHTEISSVKREETSFSGNDFTYDTPKNALSVSINPNNQAKGSNSISMDDRMSNLGNGREFEPNNMIPQHKAICTFCDYSTIRASGIEIHVERMHMKQFQCEYCTVVMTKYDLLQHYKNEHDHDLSRRYRSYQFKKANEPSSLSKCKPAAPSSSPSTSNTSNDMKKYCSFCDYTSYIPNDLVTHETRLHKVKYYCNHCPAIMAKYDLIRHAQIEHGIVLPKQARLKEANQVIDEKSDDRTSLNHSRGHSKLSESLDQGSKDSHTVIPFTENPETGRTRVAVTGRDESVEGIQQNRDNSFKESSDSSINASCPICSYVAVQPNHLKSHMDRLHKKKFHCAHCPLVMSKHELINHYKTAHDISVSKFGKSVFVEADDAENVDEDELLGSSRSSDEYSKVFVDGTSLFKCVKCEFTSVYQASIKKHFLSYHTTLYLCDLCHTVMSKYDLIQHYKNDHDITFSGLNCHKGPKFQEYTMHPGRTEQWDSQGMNQNDSEAANRSETELNNVYCSSSTTKSKGNICLEHNHIRDQFIKTLDKSGFSCTVCGFSSKFRNTVAIHAERLHVKKFSCDICFAVMTKYDLLQHSKNIHNITFHNNGRGKKFQEVVEESGSAGEQSEFVCPVLNGLQPPVIPEIECEPSVQQGASSYITQNGDNFICTVCDWASKYKGNVNTHFDTMHRKMFSCIRCSAVMNKYDMIQHYEIQHDVVINGRGAHTYKYFRSVDDISKGITEPMHTAHGGSVSAYDGENDLSDQDQSMTIIKEGKKFKCSICGFSTLHKFNLKSHFESFHQKKYSCNDCLFVTSKYGMVCHYESVHRFVIPNSGKGRIGPYCTAVTESSEIITTSVFADSMVETVMDEYPGTNDHGAVDLNITGEFDYDVEGQLEPITGEGGDYICPICGISSIWRGNMKAHIDALHKEKYSCDHCSVILTKHEMIKHSVTDHNVKKGVKSPFNKVVDTMVQDSSSFEPEIKGSDGVDPLFVFKDAGEYRCPICDFSSPLKSSCEKHLVVLHKKMYSCNKCSVVLNKYEMIQHFEIEHGVEIPNKGRGQVARFFSPVDESSHVVGLVKNESHHSVTAPLIETVSEEPDVQQCTELKCTVCNFSTKWKQNLQTHTENLHDKTFLCNYCSIILTKYEMMRHCEDNHGVSIPKYGPNMHFVETTHDDTMGVGNKEPRRSLHQPEDGGNSGCFSSDFPPKDSQCVDMPTESKNLPKRGSIVFNCMVCDFSSKLRMALQVHTKNMHSTKHRCNRCSAVMTKYELPGHYKAEHCSEGEENGDVSDAVKNVHGDVLSSPQDLLEAEDLINASSSDDGTHKRCGNPKLSIAGIGIKSETIEANDPMIIGESQCPECDFSTEHQRYLKDHIKSFHRKKYNCGRCSQIMTKFELFRHLKDKHGVVLNSRGRIPVTAAYEWSENHASTINKIEFKKPKRFPCVACTFSSFHSFGLERHIKLQHTIKYTCHLCSTILTRYALVKHYQNVHNSEIPENHFGAAKSIHLSGKPRSRPSSDDKYSSSSRNPSSTKILNPKFQAHQQTVMPSIQSSAFQPVVLLDRLPIGVDDLDSTFSVLDDTNTADLGRAASPQFRNLSSQME